VPAKLDTTSQKVFSVNANIDLNIIEDAKASIFPSEHSVPQLLGTFLESLVPKTLDFLKVYLFYALCKIS